MLGFYIEPGYQTGASYKERDTEEQLCAVAQILREHGEGLIVEKAKKYGAVDSEEKTVEEAVHYYCTNTSAFTIHEDKGWIALHPGGSVRLKEQVCRAICTLIFERMCELGINVDISCK